MPKAEKGSIKHLANKMKAKGLQRLRWYCQVCEKQCRDENGFKQHTLSEGHVRQIMVVGEDPRKYINNYSNQFKRDFLSLLRSSHGEKKVYINHFYNEYIKDKEHVHMNATRWPSLTEFAKYLGRESICKITEGERGIEIQWIDDSPEAVQRREDVRRKDLQAKGDEDMESRLLAQQIKRAKQSQVVPLEPPTMSPQVNEEAIQAAPVKFSLGSNSKTAAKPAEPKVEPPSTEQQIDTFSTNDKQAHTAPAPVKLSLNGLASKSKTNALLGKNPMSKKTEPSALQPPKKMSNAERIMREEMDRKRPRGERSYNDNAKRARYD